MTKKLVAFLMLLSAFSLMGQNRQELKIKKLFWGPKDTQKDNIEIPEKWNNESAVILFKEYFYDYHKYAKRVRYTTSIRKRVKILDKAAIETFSEFSFQKNLRVQRGFWGKKEKKYIGVKIIKPNGEEREISVNKEAVKTDDEYKLAISGLEIGDIIDYYVYTIEPFYEKKGYSFEPITDILSDSYPTKQFLLRFNTENDFFINFNSYNGAPKLEEIKTGKRNDRRYKLEASDIEKSDFPFWYFPLKELPFYKFQVVFSRSGRFEKNVFNFLPESEKIIRKEVTQDDVLKVYANRFGKFKADLKPLLRYFKKKKLSKEEMVKKAYYYLRHHYYTNYIEASILFEMNISGYFPSAANPDFFFLSDSNRFIACFGSFLNKKKIPFDIIAAKPRNTGKIDDLLFSSELTTMIRVNLDTPIYISVYDSYSNMTTMNPLLEDTEAYAMTFDPKKQKLTSLEKVMIPKSNASDNVGRENLNVSFNEDMSTITFKKNSKAFGHIKSSEQEDILFFFDYLKEDHKQFDTKGYIEKIKRKKLKKRFTKEYNSLIDKFVSKQKELQLRELQREYDLKVEEGNTLTLINTGRYGKEIPLEYTQEFTVKDQLIKRAGKNYLFEVGKLIGQQVSITQDEIERKQDIHMLFPKSYENKIVINVPEGYTVAGLDKLNKNIQNKTGSFESSASLDGSVLTIETRKAYNNFGESKDDWDQMRAFLDMAYQFSQEKILFKKL